MSTSSQSYKDYIIVNETLQPDNVIPCNESNDKYLKCKNIFKMNTYYLDLIFLYTRTFSINKAITYIKIYCYIICKDMQYRINKCKKKSNINSDITLQKDNKVEINSDLFYVEFIDDYGNYFILIINKVVEVLKLLNDNTRKKEAEDKKPENKRKTYKLEDQLISIRDIIIDLRHRKKDDKELLDNEIQSLIANLEPVFNVSDIIKINEIDYNTEIPPLNRNFNEFPCIILNKIISEWIDFKNDNLEILLNDGKTYEDYKKVKSRSKYTTRNEDKIVGN